MQTPYSLLLLKKMAHHAPPGIPDTLAETLARTIDALEKTGAPAEESEDALVRCGIALAPYRRAFHEMEREVLARRGEELLRGFLTAPLARWFDAFKTHGGTVIVLLSGGSFMLQHVEPEERAFLTHAVVETKLAAHLAARRAIATAERNEFERRVLRHEAALQPMLDELAACAALTAHTEDEYARAEMRSAIRDIELALAGIHRMPHAVFADIRGHVLARMAERDAMLSARSQTA